MLEGGTSDGDVSADIHPSERVQEMEGGEVDTELAWLARWRATKDDSPWLLPYGRDEQEKGGSGGFAQRTCTGGTTSLRRRWWS